MQAKMVGFLVASDFTQQNNERDLINWKLLKIMVSQFSAVLLTLIISV